MSYFHTLKEKWHKVRLFYLNLIVNDCLDPKLKRDLIRKIDYHQQRVTD
ncbi:hypothetical protein [Bacillus sp. EB01]|nr:hypothetical protein [Bacillus sp. EB01]